MRTLLELRLRQDLLDRYNESRRGQPPVSICPPECISNCDQSPQLVSPLPNQSLARRGKGECCMKTDGKENFMHVFHFAAAYISQTLFRNRYHLPMATINRLVATKRVSPL